MFIDHYYCNSTHGFVKMSVRTCHGYDIPLQSSYQSMHPTCTGMFECMCVYVCVCVCVCVRERKYIPEFTRNSIMYIDPPDCSAVCLCVCRSRMADAHDTGSAGTYTCTLSCVQLVQYFMVTNVYCTHISSGSL